MRSDNCTMKHAPFPSESLLPCPFCGGEPEWSAYHGVYECGKCHIAPWRSISHVGDKEAMALEWNERTKGEKCH